MKLFGKPEALAVVTSIPVLAVLWLVMPTPVFMTIHSMEVVGDQVKSERSVHVAGSGEVIADWRVTVVREDRRSPSCQTLPGPDLHQGWSAYTDAERKKTTMHMDKWVGDPGCMARLEAGEHDMFVTWTSRDGSPPVTALHHFIIE